MKKITVLLIDDHPLFRQGVADALSLNSDILIIGQAATGDEGWSMIQDLQPEVAVVDINLPGLNGPQIMQKVMLEKISSRIIFLTAYDDLEQKLHAMNLGVSAYCSKDILPEKLDWVIQEVSQGNYVYDDEIISKEKIKEFIEEQTAQAMQQSYWGGESHQALSSREMQVLLCLTKGLSNKEIALSLGISQQTVKNHITAILRKLDVADRTQAALFAMKRGWVRFYQDFNQPEEKKAE
ncbi:MAG TPA: response regulator transcription factor [Anaerolineales bacterium]|nr:response regulator transcription factor [Anaerolineales bacterium]